MIVSTNPCINLRASILSPGPTLPKCEADDWAKGLDRAKRMLGMKVTGGGLWGRAMLENGHMILHSKYATVLSRPLHHRTRWLWVC